MLCCVLWCDVVICVVMWFCALCCKVMLCCWVVGFDVVLCVVMWDMMLCVMIWDMMLRCVMLRLWCCVVRYCVVWCCVVMWRGSETNNKGLKIANSRLLVEIIHWKKLFKTFIFRRFSFWKKFLWNPKVLIHYLSLNLLAFWWL